MALDLSRLRSSSSDPDMPEVCTTIKMEDLNDQKIGQNNGCMEGRVNGHSKFLKWQPFRTSLFG